MRYLLETVLWSAAGVGTWLLTLSSVSTPEVVAAVCTSVPCALLAVAGRRALGRSWSAAQSWARWLLPLPAAVVADTARVLGLAAGVLAGRRIPAGELRRLDVRQDRSAARRAGRRAAVAGLVSAAPGTLVLDVDERSGTVLLHALGAGRPRLEEAVRR